MQKPSLRKTRFVTDNLPTVSHDASRETSRTSSVDGSDPLDDQITLEGTMKEICSEDERTQKRESEEKFKNLYEELPALNFSLAKKITSPTQ